MIGDSASAQAATRVNAEQASKRTMRGPHPFGEGVWVNERRRHPGAAPWRRLRKALAKPQGPSCGQE